MGLWTVLTPILGGIGSALVGALFGGDEERSVAGRPYTMREMMPQGLGQQWDATLARTPTSFNIGLGQGGPSFPIINKRAMGAAASLYGPAATGQTTPGFGQRMAGGMVGAMPGIMQGLNAWQNTNVQAPQPQAYQPNYMPQIPQTNPYSVPYRPYGPMGPGMS